MLSNQLNTEDQNGLLNHIVIMEQDSEAGTQDIKIIKIMELLKGMTVYDASLLIDIVKQQLPIKATIN